MLSETFSVIFKHRANGLTIVHYTDSFQLEYLMEKKIVTNSTKITLKTLEVRFSLPASQIGLRENNDNDILTITTVVQKCEERTWGIFLYFRKNATELFFFGICRQV